jgi:hypothetical protein
VDDVLGVAALLAEGGWSRLVVPWDLEGAGRRAIRLAEALGADAIGVEVGPVVVGPDGSPLWRAGALSHVNDLEGRGYEPGGVRQFLGGAGGGPSVFFSLEGLAGANRACLLEEPEPIRLARLAAELAGAGIACPADPAGRRRYWEATVERVYRYRVGRAVLGARPGKGGAVRELLEGVSRREDEVHDLRRVLRWAITGQQVAPSLTRVWDLLGPDRALERLANALGQIG